MFTTCLTDNQRYFPTSVTRNIGVCIYASFSNSFTNFEQASTSEKPQGISFTSLARQCEQYFNSQSERYFTSSFRKRLLSTSQRQISEPTGAITKSLHPQTRPKIRLPTALVVDIEDQKHRCDSDQHVLTCLSSTGFERYLAPLAYKLLKSCTARTVKMIQDVSILSLFTCNGRESKALPQKGPRTSGANIGYPQCSLILWRMCMSKDSTPWHGPHRLSRTRHLGRLLKTSSIIGRDEAFMLHKKYWVVAPDWLANSSSWVTLPSSNCF